MQVAYQQEAKGMESVKTLSVCNKRTNLHEPAYKSVSCNAVYSAVKGNSRL